MGSQTGYPSVAHVTTRKFPVWYRNQCMDMPVDNYHKDHCLWLKGDTFFGVTDAIRKTHPYTIHPCLLLRLLFYDYTLPFPWAAS